MKIRWADILVGDLILLKAGMRVECDGIMVSGINLSMDESSMTGECTFMKKFPLEDCENFMIKKRESSKSL